MLAAGVAAPSARANGDPASDVLPFGTLYFAAQNPTLTPSGRDLLFLTNAAKKKFPIRVAVIYQPSDLGLIQSLWRHPQPYAKFLGKELIAFGRYHGTLVVAGRRARLGQRRESRLPSTSPLSWMRPRRRRWSNGQQAAENRLSAWQIRDSTFPRFPKADAPTGECGERRESFRRCSASEWKFWPDPALTGCEESTMVVG